MISVSSEIRNLLEEEASRINNKSFIECDPIQFPRRFSDLRDIEITSLLVSSIAWGNRKMICKDSEKLLAIMNGEPFNYLMSEEYEKLDHQRNIHRTFFCRHLIHYLRGLRRIYGRYSSLDEFSFYNKIGEYEFPAWALAKEINRELSEANGSESSRCLPLNLENSALKRLNMALRWLVRDDGIVDIGVWRSIRPPKLFIPLDVHAGRTARSLGLLGRKANDRKATVELTKTLRTIRPEDPVFFDYALFGLGIEGFHSAPDS